MLRFSPELIAYIASTGNDLGEIEDLEQEDLTMHVRRGCRLCQGNSTFEHQALSKHQN